MLNCAHANPKVDARGFIEVWQLRDDVTALEALEVSDDTSICSNDEGDGTESLANLERLLQKQKLCEEAVHKAYVPYAKQRWRSTWLGGR
ncbi:MAG: hypothetical protein V4484_16670 [Pseudomonadota bacterium]